ncbi:MAG: FlgO family outer membrane protein [Deltaproteobacteria bacterium]|nr:FlgO family outer membrane protein [Deltaproteobacteria bacterium]
MTKKICFIVFFLLIGAGLLFAQDKTKSAQSQPAKTDSKKENTVTEQKKDTKESKKEEKKNAEAEKKEIQIKLKSVARNMSKELERIKGGAIVRVVVSSFSNNGELAKKKEIGTLVMGELMINLSKFNNIELIEREKLAKILDEMKLAQLGFADEKTAAQVGKMLQAQVVIVGEVAEAGDKFVINSRIVDVESAKVLYQEGFNSPMEGMIALSSESLVLKSKLDATYRSLILPGWGQFYNGDKIKGVVFTVAEIGIFATAVSMHINGSRKEDEYKKTDCTDKGQDCLDKVQKLKSEGEDFYKLRNYFVYGGAAVWVLNVLDAYLSGKDFDSALKTSENRFLFSKEGLRLSLTF